MSEKKVFQDQSEMNVIFVHSSLDDAGLSVYAFRVYCHIARRANRKGSAFPGADSMSSVCGMGRTKIKEAVKELEDRNMLVVHRTSGGTKSNVYVLTSQSNWIPSRNTTGLCDDPHPVAERPAPSRITTPKVIHEGNPDKDIPPTPKGECSGSELRPKKQNPTESNLKYSIHTWFKRRPSTQWSKKEMAALKVLTMAYADSTEEELAEDLDLLEWYYTKSGCKFCRRDPFTLMNNWPSEIDRAKEYKPE